MKKDDERIDQEALQKARDLLDDSKAGLLSIETQVEESLAFCLETIQDLSNENESLWFMLDEIRASDVDEHAETLNKALEEIKLEFLMKNMKPVDA